MIVNNLSQYIDRTIIIASGNETGHHQAHRLPAIHQPVIHHAGQTDMDTRILPVEIYADIICPWCYIGKRRLEAAFAERPNVTPSYR